MVGYAWRSRGGRRTLAAFGSVMGLSLSLAVPGCGGDDKLDTANLEEKLKDALSQPGSFSPNPGGGPSTYEPAVNVESVDCPDDVEPKKGAEFRCDVQGGKRWERWRSDRATKTAAVSLMATRWRQVMDPPPSPARWRLASELPLARTWL